MATIPTIDALLQSAQKVADDHLKDELLGRITQVKQDLTAKQGQIEALRAQVGATDAGTPHPLAIAYDPPA